MKNKLFIVTTAVALLLTHVAAPIAGFNPAYAAASAAADGLPKPAISRALGALLVPINKQVIKKFKLDKSDRGLLVLSVKPDGPADKQGIKPGDVLVEILGRKVHKPIDVDVAVRRQLKAGNSNFKFDVERAGVMVVVAAVITLEIYNETYSVSELSSWETTTSFEGSFSYSEYISDEMVSIEESYTSEETVVEESISHEETTSEETTSEEVTSTEDTTDDTSTADDTTADSNDAADDNASDGNAEANDDSAADSDDSSADDSGGDDASSDDSGGDDSE
ncbi:PDZ domain-containing protein [Rhizobium sp. PL01]|uniref:PDZ domain-containing protein n=1 Tax=Rhizobium sp. PL01 TaxID=3085631 RepID=UPI0029827B9E|nr:PDZ domain-containing protein [Rhizobium sp. PL01]MDW5316777.1 PDZ domain-containing protein [Rhizobium sp. PL01]